MSNYILNTWPLQFLSLQPHQTPPPTPSLDHAGQHFPSLGGLEACQGWRFSERGEVMKKRGEPIFWFRWFSKWIRTMDIRNMHPKKYIKSTLQLPSEVQRVFCSGLPSTKSSSAPLTAMSLQDTYSFNTKFTSTVWREPPIPTANVGWIASADPQHKKNKWRSDIEKNTTHLPILHVSSRKHCYIYRDTSWPILVCFRPSFQVSWRLDSHPFVFQVSFFQPGWSWHRPAVDGSVPESRGLVATRHLEVCGNLNYKKPSKLLKFPVLKFSHLFLKEDDVLILLMSKTFFHPHIIG